jgi:hypothetical protein
MVLFPNGLKLEVIEAVLLRLTDSRHSLVAWVHLLQGLATKPAEHPDGVGVSGLMLEGSVDPNPPVQN